MGHIGQCRKNVCTCILHVHVFVGEEGNNLLLAHCHCFKSSVISFEPNSIVWLKNNKIICYEQISFCSLSNLFCSDLPFSVHRGKQELKNSLTYKIYIWLFCYLYISLLLSTDCKLSVVAVCFHLWYLRNCVLYWWAISLFSRNVYINKEYIFHSPLETRNLLIWNGFFFSGWIDCNCRGFIPVNVEGSYCLCELWSKENILKPV